VEQEGVVMVEAKVLVLLVQDYWQTQTMSVPLVGPFEVPHAEVLHDEPM
jgi:hypothetical protein